MVAFLVGLVAAGMLVALAWENPPLFRALALACLMFAVFSALMLAGATPGPSLAIAAAVSYAVQRADARPGPWLWMASGLFAVAALYPMVARDPVAVVAVALVLLFLLGLVFLLVLAPKVVHWVRSRLGRYDLREPEGWEMFRLVMAEAKNWRCGALAVVCLFAALLACFEWYSLVFGLPRSEGAFATSCVLALKMTALVGAWHHDRSSSDRWVKEEFFLAVAVWVFLTVLSGGWLFSLLSS